MEWPRLTNPDLAFLKLPIYSIHHIDQATLSAIGMLKESTCRIDAIFSSRVFGVASEMMSPRFQVQTVYYGSHIALWKFSYLIIGKLRMRSFSHISMISLLFLYVVLITTVMPTSKFPSNIFMLQNSTFKIFIIYNFDVFAKFDFYKL